MIKRKPASIWPLQVKNSHHFCTGVTLDIDADGKLKWTVDRAAQKFKYGTIRAGNDDDTVVMSPNGSLAEFVNLLTIMFEFTGVESSELDVPEVPGLNPIQVRQTIIDQIYATPIGRDIKIVNTELCRCNMGNCAEVTSVTIEDFDPKTYGDLFKRFGWGNPEEDDPVKHHCYPDSVWLFIKPLEKLPETVHKEQSCYSEKIPCPITLNPNTAYISYSYCR